MQYLAWISVSVSPSGLRLNYNAARKDTTASSCLTERTLNYYYSTEVRESGQPHKRHRQKETHSLAHYTWTKLEKPVQTGFEKNDYIITKMTRKTNTNTKTYTGPDSNRYMYTMHSLLHSAPLSASIYDPIPSLRCHASLRAKTLAACLV